MNREKAFELPQNLQNRLNLIIQTIPEFWHYSNHYPHFTNHGPEHSERVHSQKLAQLASVLPERERLNSDEIFIVSAAAWLYEIGMQSPSLRLVLDIDYHPGESLSPSQLQQIRANKHLLTQRMIIDSVRRDYQGPPLRLGLTAPPDDYTRLIAEVCRGCCDEPLENVPETLPVEGTPIRLRLLVALLRLADQLYIDSSRVNLDLLERANLPIGELAKWWMYHYTQILPITNGKIQFHYFMPSSQKEYFGHIRALIEPDFEYENNPIIRYLWNQHSLHLIPSIQPTFRFDQSGVFSREMNSQLIWFLRREVEPVSSDMVSPMSELHEERCLLILDYENFIMQLGKEGYTFAPSEISHLMANLLTEANKNPAVTIDVLAIGHWARADLVETAEKLKEQIYELVTVGEQEDISERFKITLIEHLQSEIPPQQVILIAPREQFASVVYTSERSRYLLSAWISDLHEADIYRAVAKSSKLLKDVLQLPKAGKISPTDLEMIQAACILRLDDEVFKRRKNQIFLYELRDLLTESGHIATDQTDWLQLWLINHGALTIENVSQQTTISLNEENAVVAKVRAMRQAVIVALQELSRNNQDVPQDELLNKLKPSSHFKDEATILSFLRLLKEEELVYLDTRPDYPNGPLWQLSPAHWAVITLTPNRYLRQFILALDQVLVKEGYAFLNKNFVSKYLSLYFGTDALETIYDLAIYEGLICIRKTEEKGRPQEHVMLVEDHPQIVEIFRNRNTLLSILNHSSAKDGKTQGALWQQLERITGFTLNRQEFKQLLALLQKESVIIIVESSRNSERNVIKLDLESVLTQRLLGRMNLYGLVNSLRIMRATRPEKKKPSRELIDTLSKFVTGHNTKEAQWTLDYAKTIKLVSEENGQVFLNQHSFVSGLDKREKSVGKALVQLVKKLVPPESDGWVPRIIVLQEMSRSTQFGYDRGEHNYWIDQAIYRLHLLEKDRREINGRQHDVVRLLNGEGFMLVGDSVYFQAEEIALTGKSNELLRYLIQADKRICSREELLHAGWPDDKPGDVTSDALTKAMSRMKEQLEAVGCDVRWVMTVRGQGYRLQKPKYTEVPTSNIYREKAVSYLAATVGQLSATEYVLTLLFSRDYHDQESLKLENLHGELNLRLQCEGFFIPEGDDVLTFSVSDTLETLQETSVKLIAQTSGQHIITIEPTSATQQYPPLALTVEVYQTSSQEKHARQELADPLGPRPVPQPDLALRVYRQPTVNSHLRLEYVLYSPHSSLHLTGIPVRSAEVTPTQLTNFRARSEQLLRQHQSAELQSGLSVIGRELYTLLFSQGEDSLGSLCDDIADRVQSWLILDDADPWIPWELIKPHGPGWEHDFLGARYALGRWIEGWGALRQPEFPLGQVCFAQDTAMEQSPEAWMHMLTSDEAPRLGSVAPGEGLFVDWLGGYPAALDYASPVWGLHFAGYPDRLSRSLKALAVRDESWLSTETLKEHWLDLHHKAPLVTFGMQSLNGQTALTDVESKWMPTFIRAGASAFVSALWATSPQADWLFWRAFYQAIWQRVPLGEAVLQARQYIRQAMPDSMDWLAYFLVGDPMARGYIPRPGEGYTTLECVNHDLEQPLCLGQRYRFRASLRTAPPPWYRGRRYQATEQTWTSPQVFVFAHSFEVHPGTLLPLRAPIGDILDTSFELVPQMLGEHDVFVKFIDGDEVRQTLSFSVTVTEVAK